MKSKSSYVKVSNEDVQALIRAVRQNMEISKDSRMQYIGLFDSGEIIVYGLPSPVSAATWKQFRDSSVIVVNYILEGHGNEGSILLKNNNLVSRFNTALSWYSGDSGTKEFEYALWLVVSGCIPEIQRLEKSECLTLYSYKPHKP